MERPGSFQQAAEMLITNPMGFGVRDLVEENVPHHPERRVPFVGSIGIFVLFANLMSVFPAFSAPTANKHRAAGLRDPHLSLFQLAGPAAPRPGQVTLAHFAGPVPWLAPLIFPVEIISTSARILSLTVRLWANILASDLIYGIFLGLVCRALTTWGWAKTPVLGAFLGASAGDAADRVHRSAHLRGHRAGLHFHDSAVVYYLGMATADEH